MTVLSPLLAMQLLENNQSGRYLLVNAALYTLEGLIRVLSRSAGAVPASPAEGDAYIVDTVADGWATATLGDIALYYGSAWHFITPVEGMEIPIADEQSRAMWTGSLWHVTDYGMALAADPPDPPNNMRCTWQSDGTGSGDDGDIMMKITDSTGTTRTITVGGESGPTYYSVTYDDNESTSGSVPVDSNQYLSGDFANTLDNTGTLEKTGYEFYGWNTAPDGSGTDYYFEDTFEITGNVTLYAKWGLEYLSVTYDDNGSTNGPSYVPVDENGYISGDTVTVFGNIYNLYKTDYDFYSWNTEPDGSGTDYYAYNTFEITGNVTLYAKWSLSYLEVVYDRNGATSGDAPWDSNEYESGDTVTVVSNFGDLAKTGYTFSGWNTEPDGSGTDYAPAATFEITVNTVLYAKWTAV